MTDAADMMDEGKLAEKQRRRELEDLLATAVYRERWDQLDEDQQARVRWPDRYIAGEMDTRNITLYPLTLSQAAELVERSEEDLLAGIAMADNQPPLPTEHVDQQAAQRRLEQLAEQPGIPTFRSAPDSTPQFLAASVIAAFTWPR